MIRAIGEIRVELNDGNMNIKDFLSEVRALGFPQDTVYSIDDKQKKLYCEDNLSLSFKKNR